MPPLGQFGEFVPGCSEGESWIEYVERLNFYFVANSTKDGQKLAVLLSVVGAECFRIIRSVLAPDRLDALSFSEVVRRMAAHFNPTPSAIVQRCRFHRRRQLNGESITDYVTHLRKLTEHCRFTDINDRLRDQLVAGVLNDKLQCRLLEQVDLSFDTALSIALNFETALRDTSKLRERSFSNVPVQKLHFKLSNNENL